MVRLHAGVHVRSDTLRREREGARYVAVRVERFFRHLETSLLVGDVDEKALAAITRVTVLRGKNLPFT